MTPSEEALLSGRERPIVIARRRQAAPVARGVAPGSPDLGVMLPYSPLHHLLAADVGETLVMTSGNHADEPIAYDDDDALERLAEIADALLVGDRAIHMRTDDSVVRAVDPTIREAPILIRRSRGYAPASVALPIPAPRQVLGCGAELKNTFCLAKGERAWAGHHIGDLKNYETLESYRAGIDHFERLFAVEPQVVAHDMHPDYLATRYALARAGVETVAVQHHHAHMAACLAEHAITEPAVGAIFDGAGYGDDATVWGGEILAGDLAGFERAGLLFPVRLPGGDAAAREPWRMACAWLGAAFETDAPTLPATLVGAVTEADWSAICGLISSGLNSPLTTSAGRLFDAVAAICGVRARVVHEGQAAAELEGLANPAETGAYPMGLVDSASGGLCVIDPRETVRRVRADIDAGADVSTIAAPLPQCAGRRHRPRLRAVRPTAAGSLVSSCPAASFRTACCSRAVPGACALRASRCASRPFCRPTTAASPTARWLSPSPGRRCGELSLPLRIRSRTSTPGSRASLPALRCWSRSASRLCSAFATPPIPIISSRSPRWSLPRMATTARRSDSAPGGD